VTPHDEKGERLGPANHWHSAGGLLSDRLSPERHDESADANIVSWQIPGHRLAALS
jgi:hypothetical protein